MTFRERVARLSRFDLDLIVGIDGRRINRDRKMWKRNDDDDEGVRFFN